MSSRGGSVTFFSLKIPVKFSCPLHVPAIIQIVERYFQYFRPVKLPFLVLTAFFKVSRAFPSLSASVTAASLTPANTTVRNDFEVPGAVPR